jgi:hypothetical protein
VHKILFRQNLREEVEDLYSDLIKIVKNDWATLQNSFKIQFEIEIDVEANKYLLLQRVITLTQRSNETIIEYFKRTKSLIKHLLSSTKIIDYNVVKEMRDKVQRKRMNFECNKNRNFLLKKIKLIIQAVYQTMNTMSSFDSKWNHNHSSDSFNLDKKKEKALSFEEWNQQILFSILQDIKNIILQNETRKTTKIEEENDHKSLTFENKASESYDESRNVICFDCEQKKHYVNECSKSRQMRETKSSLITTQVILSIETKEREEHLSKCVLLDSAVIAITTRSEEIKKKEVTQLAWP